MTATYVAVIVQWYAHSADLLGVQILADVETFTVPEIRDTRSLEDRMFLSPESIV
jgi:hypothetical protein